jgi:methylenetetrahydrofolate--tRNA-(uracil-5-)-methyltransferase
VNSALLAYNFTTVSGAGIMAVPGRIGCACDVIHKLEWRRGSLLAETWQVRSRPSLFFAGQISGVEGYVESAASGLLAGINAAAVAGGRLASSPPRTTAIGALAYYVSHADRVNYQPSNITFGIMAPLEQVDRRLRRDRKARNEAIAARALKELDSWSQRST